MNKADLIAHVMRRADLSRRVATDAVDAVLDAITHAVANGERVSLAGFGSFEKRLRAPRAARNPRTGQAVKIPATSLPVFRPSQDFKDRVAGKRGRRR